MIRPCIIAHRCASSPRHENTILGIETAVAHGANFAEIDLRVSADGAIVALHDRSVSRTTSGAGLASRQTLSQLQALTIATLPNGDQVRIPTFHECVEAAGDRIGLLFELKDRMAPSLLGQLVEFCKAAMSYERFILAARNERMLAAIRRIDSAVITGRLSFLEPLLMHFRRRKPLHYDVLIVNELLVNRGLVMKAQKLGLKVFVSSTRSVRDKRVLCSLGVNGIYVDLEPASDSSCPLPE